MHTKLKKSILQVVVPVPYLGIFDYLAPINSSIQPLVGMRVKVPFGNKTLIGIITNLNQNSSVSTNKLKPILEILDATPFFTELELEMMFWLSKYYCQPLGGVLKSYLPQRLRTPKTSKLDKPTSTYILVAKTGLDISLLKRSPQQRELYQSLVTTNNQNITTIKAKYSSNIIKALLDKNYIQQLPASPQDPKLLGTELTLNQEQQQAVDTIASNFGKFKVCTLMGVTGSGKTEVYLQLINQILKRKQQVLLLVPEIGLTPQTINRVKTRFNAKLIVMHSGLSDKAKATAWLDCKDLTPKIVIGTRMAAFAPLANLGLVVIDEEHDLSFKQQEKMRYHARDFIITKANKLNCPVVLASATPSLETVHNCVINKYKLIKINKRANAKSPPKFSLIDIRHNKLTDGLSNASIAMIKDTVSDNKQVLVFINRRGFAPMLVCGDCDWAANCSNCSSRKTLHLERQQLICHHCNLTTKVPNQCPKCNSLDIYPVGIGTERIVSRLKQVMFNAKIKRVDKDTTSGVNAWQQLQQQINNSEVDILVGTQMLAKGHHFPDIALVLILDVDGAFFSNDFRAFERLSQQLIQVAGRAGRGDAMASNVIVQTMHPQHAVISSIVKQDYLALAGSLLQERKQLNLPPYSFHAHLVFSSTDLDANTKLIARVIQQLQNYYQTLITQQQLLFAGPLTLGIVKQNKVFKSYILIQASTRKLRNTAINYANSYLEQLKLEAKQLFKNNMLWWVDIDPV